MSKRRERTTSAISAGRKKRQKVAWNSERDQGLLQDFNEDESNSESQENVTSGGVSSHVFPISQSDAASQEAEGYESSALSELEHESEHDNERTSQTNGDGDEEGSTSEDTESGNYDDTYSASSYHLSESEDDRSSIRTVCPRTRKQSIRSSDVESTASNRNGDSDEDSSSLTQLSDGEGDSSSLAQQLNEEGSDNETSTAGGFPPNPSSDAKSPNFSVRSDDYLGEESSVEGGDDEDDGDVGWHPELENNTKKGIKASKTSRGPPSEQEKSWLRNVFKINDTDMQSTAGKLRFPYFPDPLLVGEILRKGTDAKSVPTETQESSGRRDDRKPKYYDASTITPEQMKGRDLWEFVRQGAWRRHRSPPVPPPSFYQPLKIVQDRPAEKIFDPPVESQPMAGKKVIVHGNIQAHFNWLKYFIEVTRNNLYLGTELVRSEKLPGRRPELPEAYEAALKAENPMRSLRQREETPPPGYGPPSAEPSPVKKVPSGDDFKRSKEDVPSIVLPTSVQELATGTSVAEFRPAAIPKKNTSLADDYIQKNSLTSSKADAEKVSDYLLPFQRDYDLEDTKLRLSNLTGINEKEGNRIDCITYLPREEIEKKDQLERCGNIMLDKSIPYADLFSAKKALQWLEYTGEEIALIVYPSELEIEQQFGRLLTGLFSSQKCFQTANKDIKLQQHLRLFGTTPRPDLAVRVCGHVWKYWGTGLLLCMACGDCKVLKDNRHDPKWAAQLAMAMGPTLNILILIHLDTREHAHSLMPHWMWLPGMIYTQKGFTLYAHHPGVFFDKETEEWKWKHVSVELSQHFSHIYPASVTSGVQAEGLQTMYLLRSHYSFVLDQIEAWESTRGQFGQGIMDQFIARAHYDDEDWEWLRNKAKTYKAPSWLQT